MTNKRKEDLLYQKARGQGMDASSAEQKELHKYKITADDGVWATRANIRAYIKAVDSGSHLPFYDWCMNNHKADRRRKGSSKSEMASQNRWDGAGVMMLGWLTWGVTIYWIANQRLPVGTCAIAGAVLSVVLFRLNRRLAGFTLFLLPILIGSIIANI